MLAKIAKFLKSSYGQFPESVQNAGISVYNSYLWKKRRRGRYHELKAFYANVPKQSQEWVRSQHKERLNAFLQRATDQSQWYAAHEGKALDAFPLLEKVELLNNLDKIATVDESAASVSMTGGTTGASMKVLYTAPDVEERFAILDWFRSLYGWELGKRTAWFSGKSLVDESGVANGKPYRDDWINKIRFFSTFHVNAANFDHYWNALNSFAPEYIVGFPSSVYDIAYEAIQRGKTLERPVKVFFPTAETVTGAHRDLIGRAFGCEVKDQYASSEGAPFILECPSGRMHIHPLTGVFEVVDEDGISALEGEMIVTSFTTNGTPLIRYRIGDRLVLSDDPDGCTCGWPFPAVERIDGRTSDCFWSPERGRVALGNISNCAKDIAGIRRFQITQTEPDAATVLIEASDRFPSDGLSKFEQALRERVGTQMTLHIRAVEAIPVEASGKFRMLKTSISLGKA